MKIDLVSDLHLEFAQCIIENENQADVLILAGDIVVAAQMDERIEGAKYTKFFKQFEDQYKHVLMVMGNHDHYHGDIGESEGIIRDFLEMNKIKNVTLLEKESINIDGVNFFGATFWSDMNKGDPLTLGSIGSRMNDFFLVSNKWTGGSAYSSDRFLPTDAAHIHKVTLNELQKFLETRKDEKNVVISHHLPSFLSVPPAFRHETIMNGGYFSELSELIMDNPSIVLWMHGHTHEPCDYELEKTHVVCHPRGYFPGQHSKNYKPKLIEI